MGITYESESTELGLTPEKVSDVQNGSFSYFSNKISLQIGYKVQPCLDAIFSLRDFLVTFVFQEFYELSKEPSKQQLEAFFERDDRFDLGRLFLPAFKQIEPVGIIAQISTFRNVFFHYLGISSSGPIATCYCFRSKATTLGNIPYLIYPLDDNYKRLRTIETGKFENPADKEMAQVEAKRFMSLPVHIDALDLCFDSLCCLLRIAEAAESNIDLPSEAMIITADQIIKATFTSDGNERRYERDADGILREVD